MTNWVLSLLAGSSSGGLSLFYNGRSLSRPHTKPLRGKEILSLTLSLLTLSLKRPSQPRKRKSEKWSWKEICCDVKHAGKWSFSHTWGEGTPWRWVLLTLLTRMPETKSNCSMSQSRRMWFLVGKAHNFTTGAMCRKWKGGISIGHGRLSSVYKHWSLNSDG